MFYKIELNVVSAFTLIKHEHRIITTKLWSRWAIDVIADMAMLDVRSLVRVQPSKDN